MVSVWEPPWFQMYVENKMDRLKLPQTFFRMGIALSQSNPRGHLVVGAAELSLFVGVRNP